LHPGRSPTIRKAPVQTRTDHRSARTLSLPGYRHPESAVAGREQRDNESDPYQMNNLAGQSGHAALQAELEVI